MACSRLSRLRANAPLQPFDPPPRLRRSSSSTPNLSLSPGPRPDRSIREPRCRSGTKEQWLIGSGWVGLGLDWVGLAGGSCLQTVAIKGDSLRRKRAQTGARNKLEASGENLHDIYLICFSDADAKQPVTGHHTRFLHCSLHVSLPFLFLHFPSSPFSSLHFPSFIPLHLHSFPLMSINVLAFLSIPSTLFHVPSVP